MPPTAGIFINKNRPPATGNHGKDFGDIKIKKVQDFPKEKAVILRQSPRDPSVGHSSKPCEIGRAAGRGRG